MIKTCWLGVPLSLLLATALAWSAERPSANEVVKVVVKEVAKGGISPETMRLLAERDDVLLPLREILPTLGKREQERVVTSAMSVDGIHDPAHPWFERETLVGFLVDVAFKGEVEGVGDDARDLAIDFLTRFAVDRSLRVHAATIIAWARQHPKEHKVIMLLGKTGAAEAVPLLAAEGSLAKLDQERAALARAKLGVQEDIDALIKAFREAADPAARFRQADGLGYVGSPGCAVALVRELRSTATVDLGGGNVAMRHQVVKALSQIYPSVGLLKTTHHGPSDEQLDGIEAWVQSRFGISWDGPRPAVEGAVGRNFDPID